MTPLPRVLLVVANGGPGGMQVQVGLLARGLHDAGAELAVACGPGELDAGPARVIRIGALTAGSFAAVLRELRAVVRRERPTLVHGHGLRLCAVLAGAPRGAKLVTCHGIAPERVRNAALLARASRVAVASCGEGPRRLLAAAGVRSRVLDNAIPPLAVPLSRDELAARFGLDPALALVVSPARMTPQKDPLTLVRALALAPGVAGILLGDGPLQEAARAEVARLGCEDRVAISPWHPDARSMLGAADMLAISSLWEGQPTVVLEAMALGVPVVATSCTGTAETVADGLTGLLSPVGDANGLARSMQRVAGDGALRSSLVEAGRAQAAGHTVAAMVAAHLDAYERLLAKSWP